MLIQFEKFKDDCQSFITRKEVCEKIDNILKDNIIEESTSQWLCHVVLVTEKDGSIKFYEDYCRPNEVIKKNSYPLPRVANELNTVTGSK